MFVIRHSEASTVHAFEGMIDGSPVVNRVLADLGDVPGTGKNICKGVEITDKQQPKSLVQLSMKEIPEPAYQQPTQQVSRK